MTKEELSKLIIASDITRCIENNERWLSEIKDGAKIEVVYEYRGIHIPVRIGKEMLEHIKEEVVMHLEARVNELQKQFDEL